MTTARFMARYSVLEEDGEEDFTYVDNSDVNESPYSRNSENSTLADVIAYMTARMERLGFAVPEEDFNFANRVTGR